MRTLKLYSNDFSKPHNGRDTESSTKVVESWFDPMTRYAVEEIPDARCLRLVAERIVVRTMLGLGALDEGFVNRVASVEVFGCGTPSVSELFAENVSIAMAFVPVTPLDEKGRPYLARLYCVGGLSRRYADLPLEGIDDSGLQKYSWFLEGVPREDIKRGIVGRSWLLAAQLLTEVVRKRDKKTARNLAKHFIVTGDVDGDVIRKVEIKRKPELAMQFESFKWIIPEENDMDIPRRKIEKPATLEEAYKLIESMQSVATRSLFNALHNADLKEAKVQFEKMGADLYAIDAETGLTAMTLVAKKMRSAEKAAKGMTWARGTAADEKHPTEFAAAKKVEQYREIRSWLRSNGADPVMMFYVLAKLGMMDVLRQILAALPIDARDEDGYNATELALKNTDYGLAKQLFSLGCRCRGKFSDGFMTEALESYVGESTSLMDEADEARFKENRKLIETALSLGLSPDCNVSVLGGLRTTLFGAALYKCDVDMIKQCLSSGADPNLEIEIWQSHYEDDLAPGDNGWYWSKNTVGSPLYVANCGNGSVQEESRIAVTKLLGEFGAHPDGKVAKRQYEEAVKRLGSNADSKKNRECILRSLSEGFPFDLPKNVRYCSCGENPRSEDLQTTLWGWAVYNGDIEIMRKCLEVGANVTSTLKFAHCDQNHIADLQYLNGRTPVEVILMSEDLTLEQQNQVLELLCTYGLKESDCPNDLLSKRHPEELAKLKSYDDVMAKSAVDLGSGEIPELATTTAFGKALWYMWVDVLERCLSLGASARNIVYYRDWYGGPNGETIDMFSGAPLKIVKKNDRVPSWLRNRAIKLLAKYANE